MHGRVLLPMLLAIATPPGVGRADTVQLADAAMAVRPSGIPAAPGFARSGACAAPSNVTAPNTGLQHVENVLRVRGTLDILAVGSATMLGPRGGAEGSYPDRMVALLRAAFPTTEIRLTVHGGRGLTAAEMLVTLRTELSQRPYQLVLWQTATVEAIRNLPAAELAQTLADGAALVRTAGANLVVIDPQYSRFLRANANLDPYLQAVSQTGSLADVAVFGRYRLMKYWAETGQIDLEGASKSERQTIADVLHDCLARALAQFIVQGVSAAPP